MKTMTNPTSQAKLALMGTLFATAMALTGCGGGGGSTPAPAPVASPTPAPVVQTPTAGNLQTSVPTPTYAATAPELALFNQLNAERAKGGYGMLAQNAALDLAAKNHANYLLTNFYSTTTHLWNFGTTSGHIEEVGKPGFTGITSTDRAKYAGYSQSGIAGEDASFVTDCVTSLSNSVYHRMSLLTTTYSEVGFSQLKAADGIGAVCVVNPGTADRNLLNSASSTWAGVFPQDGVIGIETTMRAENPDPVPSAPVKGYPFSVAIESTRVLTVTSFTLTDNKGNVVPSVVLTPTSPGTFNFYYNNTSYLVPTQALASGMTYTAMFVGTNNGVPFSRTWVATTK